MTNVEQSDISINQLDVPEYVKNLMVLDSLGKTVAESTTMVDGAPALRVPLREVIYRDMDDAEDAVLQAMGY